MRTLLFTLTLSLLGFPVLAQDRPSADLKEGDRLIWNLLARSEEVAMCHHAVIAAHYEAKYIGMGQNPVYRYVLDSGTRSTDRVVIYPSPERCQSQVNYFLVRFNDERTGGELRKAFSDRTGLSAEVLLKDMQFFDMVVTKKTVEGDGAGSSEPDSDISGDPWVYKVTRPAQ